MTGRSDIRAGEALISGTVAALAQPVQSHSDRAGRVQTETGQVRPYHFTHQGVKYILVDTPGFGDTYRSYRKVTAQILTWLARSPVQRQYLSGVIYLHRISDPRMGGTALKNMRMFRKLVGKHALSNVVLATTFWDQVPPAVGLQREDELRQNRNFWGGMLKKGARLTRLRNDRQSALDLIVAIYREQSRKDEETRLKLEMELHEKQQEMDAKRQRRLDEERRRKIQRPEQEVQLWARQQRKQEKQLLAQHPRGQRRWGAQRRRELVQAQKQERDRQQRERQEREEQEEEEREVQEWESNRKRGEQEWNRRRRNHQEREARERKEKQERDSGDGSNIRNGSPPVPANWLRDPATGSRSRSDRHPYSDRLGTQP